MEPAPAHPAADRADRADHVDRAAEPAMLTPSAVAMRLRGALRSLGGAWLEGEVRGLKVQGGHAWFSIADADASLRCVVWRARWGLFQGQVREGVLVQARFSRVDYYPANGVVTLIVEDLRPTGEGELLRRQQETLALLRADGLCEPSRRPRLPRFPRRIGVVAGWQSDAQADVVTAIRERFAPARIVCVAARVQGTDAVDSVIGALARLEAAADVDVIVLARGGGSVQDLHPFSDERLCRAIAACATPVVTSIGHTRQRPNCDHVASAAADVPARTAEIVVPSGAELRAGLARTRQLLARRAGETVAEPARALVRARARLRPARLLEPRRDRLARHRAELDRGADRLFHARRRSLDGLAGRLDAATRRPLGRDRLERLQGRLEALQRVVREQRLHDRRRLDGHAATAAPRATARLADAGRALAHAVALVDARDWRRRGFAVVRPAGGEPVATVAGFRSGQWIDVELADGRIEAVVARVATDQTADEGAGAARDDASAGGNVEDEGAGSAGG